MKSRREMLAAGALALPAFALSARGSTLLGAVRKADCQKPLDGPMARYFPNVVVTTHDNRKALFYDDLLKGKIVTINFISTRDRAADEVTANLVKLQKILGDRVGDDIFMITITMDPEHDTPKVLKEFAAKQGVGPGWTFVTGSPENMQALLGRIFVGPHDHHSPNGLMSPGCSRGLVRYGNTVTGPFGSFPASLPPEYLALRFDMVAFRKGTTKVAV